MELCNAFTELNDPLDQESRFLEMGRDYDADDEERHPMDEDYLRAMRYGMPPNGGFGMGVDRLTMLLTDNPNIREVILFPHLRKIEEVRSVFGYIFYTESEGCMVRQIKVVVEKHPDGYVAYPLGLKGVVGEGGTYEEAGDVKSAVAFHIETFGPKDLTPVSSWKLVAETYEQFLPRPTSPGMIRFATLPCEGGYLGKDGTWPLRVIPNGSFYYTTKP